MPQLYPPSADAGEDPVGYVDEPIEFRGTGTDTDGSIATYRWDFESDGYWDYQGSSGTASNSYGEAGNYNATLEVEDDDGLTAQDTCRVTVKERPQNQRPEVSISSPENGSEVSGKVVIKGSASDLDGEVEKVEVSVGEGGWDKAAGVSSWSYEVDTTDLANGLHTVRARAYDGGDYSLETKIEIKVKNENSPPHIISSDIEPKLASNNGVDAVTVTANVQDSDGSEDIDGVHADLSPVGGSASAPMFDDGSGPDQKSGDQIYTLGFTIAPEVPPGTKTLTLTVSDKAEATDSETVTLVITSANAPPEIKAAGAEPDEASNSGEDYITIYAEMDDENGLADIAGVYADLSEVRGSRSQQMYDDGSHDDDEAGDGVYKFRFRVPFTVEPGDKRIEITVEGSGGHSASENITVEITRSKSGDDNQVEASAIPFPGLEWILVCAASAVIIMLSRRRKGQA